MAVAQIARAAGTVLKSSPGLVLRLDAAAAWDDAVGAFGKNVLLSGAWRSLETQLEIFMDRYKVQWFGSGPYNDVRWYKGIRYVRVKGAAAARPGTSNHGGGVAVDVKTSRSPGDPDHDTAVVFTSWNDPDRIAFLKVAAAYGWADDEGANIGNVYRGPNAELWHLTYYPERDTHPGRKSAPKRAKTVRIPKVTAREWQRQLGVDDDGVLGHDSWEAVQRKINAWDDYGHFLTKGKLAVDGDYGNRTQQALISALNYLYRIGKVKFSAGYLNPDLDRFGYRRLGALRLTLHKNLWKDAS